MEQSRPATTQSAGRIGLPLVNSHRPKVAIEGLLVLVTGECERRGEGIETRE